MKSTQRIIAICSCAAHFFDSEESIDRMNSHINDNNYKVHQWVEVPNIIGEQGDHPIRVQPCE